MLVILSRDRRSRERVEECHAQRKTSFEDEVALPSVGLHPSLDRNDTVESRPE